jgi:TrmH family RNA methyltransferase
MQSPNQALAVLKQFIVPLPAYDTKEWMLLLDGIQDPGNMGTIIRNADWFGIRHVLCTPDCADKYNAKVVQASMGSLARVGVHTIDTAAWMRHYKGHIIGAVLEGESVQGLSFPSYGLMVIGREGSGIREEIRSCITKTVSIPSFGDAESLNAAVATGILLWEMRKVIN